jgi:hypothetical protein
MELSTQDKIHLAYLYGLPRHIRWALYFLAITGQRRILIWFWGWVFADQSDSGTNITLFQSPQDTSIEG